MKEENNNICPICGKPTRVYMGNARKDKLCGEHADMLKKGTIELNKEGIYVYSDSKKPINQKEEHIIKKPAKAVEKEEASEEHHCLICGKPSGKNPLCYEHYKEAHEMAIQLLSDKKDKTELIVYYRNLQNQMYHMRGDEILKENYIKLMAIAIALDEKFNYHIQYNSIGEDLEKIKQAHSKKSNYQSEITKKLDEVGGQVFRSDDNHTMDSFGEVVVDNILFELSKDPALILKQIAPVHTPHYVVSTIVERGVNADWYVEIPLYAKANFVIEFWGMKNNSKYEANKKEKQQLYKDSQIDLFGIEYDEIKDPNVLKMRIKNFIIDRTINNK